eukprot:366341-Chlamydomonas_euryale.AAC.27
MYRASIHPAFHRELVEPADTGCAIAPAPLQLGLIQVMSHSIVQHGSASDKRTLDENDSAPGRRSHPPTSAALTLPPPPPLSPSHLLRRSHSPTSSALTLPPPPSPSLSLCPS